MSLAHTPAPAALVDPASPQAVENPSPLVVAKALAGLPRRDRLVLNELILLADRHGHAQPSQDDLATATRLSVRSVRDALKALQASGWISREAVSLGKAGRSNDRYTVHAAPRSEA